MSTIRIPTRAGQVVQPLAVAQPVSRVDRLAERVLAGGLSVGLGAVFLIQFAGWLPHYLTWPWWSDADVFASLALGWHRGLLPYRDLAGNNFPGTIYIHWLAGRLFGWGWSPAVGAIDAGLLLGLGGVFLAWSRRRLGGVLPGLVGFVAFASYYFGLNYALAAQRDWQGPCLAVAALLLLDGWPGRASRWVSGLGLAMAFAIRPQVVLLGPAFLLVLDDARRRGDDAGGALLPRIAEWCGAVALGVMVAFLPLALAGVLGDFLGSLRHVAYGGTYNRTGAATVGKRLLQEFLPLQAVCVPALVALLAVHSRPNLRRVAWTALIAYACVALYKPLSPIPAPYLDTPLRLVESILLALVVAMAVQLEALVPSLRLGLVLAVLPVGIVAQPQFCDAASARRALRDVRHCVEPEQAPAGYLHNYLRAPYPWSDYRRVLAYLRAHTGPETRVANALKHDPALAGAVGRLPAFSAESLAWLRMVNPADEPRFVKTLEATTDSVVVWAPGEANNGEKPFVPSIFAAIERLYEPEARFGVIEVWRRKPGPSARQVE